MIWTRHRPGFYTSGDYVIERTAVLSWAARYEGPVVEVVGPVTQTGFLRSSYPLLRQAKRACEEHRKTRGTDVALPTLSGGHTNG